LTFGNSVEANGGEVEAEVRADSVVCGRGENGVGEPPEEAEAVGVLSVFVQQDELAVSETVQRKGGNTKFTRLSGKS